MGKMTAGKLSPSVLNDFKHACAISLSLAFFLLVVFIDWDPIFHGRFLPTSTPASFEGPSSGVSDRLQLDLIESPVVRKLIEDIQAATREASGGVYTDLTAAEREEWSRQNLCRSRSELQPMYDRRKHVKELSPNPILDLVLAEYSKLHRACMLKVGPNVTDFFIHNMTVPGCKFTIGSPMYGTGLGNKMIVTISAILYSILTQRIILVPTRTNLPSFMCEPFVGSSWMLDSSTFIFPDGPKGQLPWESAAPFPPEWTEDVKFLKEMDEWIMEERSTGSNATIQPPALNHALSVTVRWQPDSRFYCRTEQRMVDQVPWLYWGGCIYSVPKMFSSPVFSRFLDALFPDRMVMARLLRSMLLPDDNVFSKLKELDNQYFRQADRRVGIQLRSRQGKDYYEKMNATFNKRILDCVLENGILPNGSSWENEESHPPSSSTKVFIASLYRDLLDYLEGVYQDVRTVSGEEVEVIQVTSNEEQKLSKEEDVQAFVEILALSLSDQLLVTPSSTFGSVAQGYGALVPWFIEIREDTAERTYSKACERAQSIDICHQHVEKFVYECPHDPFMDEKPILDSDPSLKKCLDIDHDSGFQLISTFQSDF